MHTRSAHDIFILEEKDDWWKIGEVRLFSKEVHRFMIQSYLLFWYFTEKRCSGRMEEYYYPFGSFYQSWQLYQKCFFTLFACSLYNSYYSKVRSRSILLRAELFLFPHCKSPKLVLHATLLLLPLATTTKLEVL